MLVAVPSSMKVGGLVVVQMVIVDVDGILDDLS